MNLRRLGPRTLRGRVTLGTATVLAVVLGVMAVLVDDVVRRHARRAMEDQMTVEAQALSVLVRLEAKELEIETEGAPAFGRFAVPRGGVYYQVSANGRRPVRSPSLAGAELPVRPTTGEVPPAGSPQVRWHTEPGPHEERLRVLTYTVGLPILVENDDEPAPGAPREAVAIQVAHATTDAERQQADVRRALAIALPIALLLGTLGAFLVARRATAPIDRLSREARAIGGGDASARLDVAHVEGELRALAETLNEAFSRLSAHAARERRFAADAAHELRTPLAILRSRIELALDRERPPEEYRAALRTALEAGIRLEAVARALLLLARSEGGDLRRETVDLRAVVRRAAETAAAAVPAAGKAPGVLASLPEEPVTVVGDAVLLERLVANLLQNAMEHGGAGGTVEVSLRAEGDSARLVVEDRGPGFPPELLPRLFEPFARGDASRTRATGGAGLGLSIVRTIARAHGGDATAGARSGGGARVEVVLPRATTEPEIVP